MKGVFYIAHKDYGMYDLPPLGTIVTGEFERSKGGESVICFSCSMSRMFYGASHPYGSDGRYKRPHVGWSYLFVCNLKTGEILGSGWKVKAFQPPEWLLDPMLRAVRLAQWKEEQKKGKRHARSKDIRQAV